MFLQELNLINFSIALALGIILLGFIIYKTSETVSSWEDGIKSIFVFLRDAFYEELTGHIPKDKEVNPRLILSNEHVLMLCEKFSNNPYNNPYIKEYIPNYDGVSWYRIEAFNLTKEYQSLSRVDLERMCRIVIEKFFTELLGYSPKINISLVSTTVLCFEIALSKAGEKRLQSNREDSQLVLLNGDSILEDIEY